MAKGPRPWTVWVFCITSLALAAYRSVLYFANLTGVQPMFEAMVPFIDWNKDAVIIATSAWLTIDMIPVALVWLLASRFARGFIFVMAIMTIPVAIYLWDGQFDNTISMLVSMIGGVVPIALATLLFLPLSQKWFAVRRGNETVAFE